MKGKGNRSEPGIRSFVAIDVPGNIRDGLEKIIARLKPIVRDVKWVRTGGIHLTLKFLGNVPESMIPSLRNVMEDAARGAGPFDIEVKGLGAFPDPTRARVLWVGIEEPSGALRELAERIERGMESLGFAPETRPFHPHLTVGRARKGGKPGKEVGGFIERYHSEKVGTFTASEVVLFRSDLKPAGAVYTRLETVRLV